MVGQEVKHIAAVLRDRFESNLSKLKDERGLALRTEESRQLELDRATAELTESQNRAERLSRELGVQKSEFSDHYNKQKIYIQDLQSNCIQLEERVNAANREIMNEYKARIEELSKQEREVVVDDSAAQRAFQALARKDLQMAELEKALKEANTTIATAREERTKTIEAHQSRIKHLQDKYLQDVKIASQEQVKHAELALETKLKALHENAIKELETRLNEVVSRS
ncbi:hypothetical protein HDU91_002398 [Kappamyces sp. JEL0680]|nr:hypothetical protein HDU91_002398 [Kappamyces sp. JEL0680]